MFYHQHKIIIVMFYGLVMCSKRCTKSEIHHFIIVMSFARIFVMCIKKCKIRIFGILSNSRISRIVKKITQNKLNKRLSESC